MSDDARVLDGALIPADMDWSVDEQLRRVIELKESGVSWGDIAYQVGAPVKEVHTRWLAHKMMVRSHFVENREAYRVLEMERLDALWRANWDAAMEGDKAAGELLLKISRRRDEVMGGMTGSRGGGGDTDALRFQLKVMLGVEE